ACCRSPKRWISGARRMPAVPRKNERCRIARPATRRASKRPPGANARPGRGSFSTVSKAVAIASRRWRVTSQPPRTGPARAIATSRRPTRFGSSSAAFRAEQQKHKERAATRPARPSLLALLSLLQRLHRDLAEFDYPFAVLQGEWSLGEHAVLKLDGRLAVEHD